MKNGHFNLGYELSLKALLKPTPSRLMIFLHSDGKSFPWIKGRREISIEKLIWFVTSQNSATL